jgi:hypothetical protein
MKIVNERNYSGAKKDHEKTTIRAKAQRSQRTSNRLLLNTLRTLRLVCFSQVFF